MNIIILAAGRGTRLYPLTLEAPKCLLNLNSKETLIERMIRLIKKNLSEKIIVVTGFKHECLEKKLSSVKFVNNPFYAVTNSIASLWFAKDYLNDEAIIMNSDIIIEEKLMKDLRNIKNEATVLIDSSISREADYKVAVYNDQVVVMSKDLVKFDGEYAGITILSKKGSKKLKEKIESMVQQGYINSWYEDALVKMIFDDSFKINYFDIADYKWAEVDTVDDLQLAKQISGLKPD